MSEHDPELTRLFDLLRQAAEQGNLEAQFRLAMAYGSGDHLPLDHTAAAHWFKRAADAGHAEAMRALAALHASGLGVAQDNAAARRWLLAAAEAGSAAAQCAVAAMYQFGHHGAEPDTTAMLSWYRRAAEQGHATAQFALGKLMAAGDRVQQNDEAAFQWLSLAILHGSEPAKRELAQLTARIDSETLNRWQARMMERMAAGAAPEA